MSLVNHDIAIGMSWDIYPEMPCYEGYHIVKTVASCIVIVLTCAPIFRLAVVGGNIRTLPRIAPDLFFFQSLSKKFHDAWVDGSLAFSLFHVS